VKKAILYFDNKKTNNNNNIDNENTIKSSLTFNNIGYRERERERERIKKKNCKMKQKKKMKYNDLIYSINKRK